jgi:hypothetical protein
VSNPFPKLLTMPLRKMRADALTAHIMHLVGPYIEEHGDHDARRDCARALFAAFYDSGVEVISEADRALAGLPPRIGDTGMTSNELAIIEARHTEAMLKPVSVTLAFPEART